MSKFVSDIAAIRRRAREHMEDGAVTRANTADRVAVITVLNDVLATEITCVLRYKRHYYMASGLNSEAIRAEFAQHAQEEQAHADAVSERITQLNGAPDLNPATLKERSHAEYVEGDTLVDMLKEDLVAERIAIESYGEIVRWLGERDPTTRRLIERILEQEEEHAEDLKTLLDGIAVQN